MVPYSEALSIILSRMPLLPAERATLDQSLGRTLASDIVAGWALPSFDNSQMDGYAVVAADLAGASADRPVTLAVSQRILAGAQNPPLLLPGTVARVMTGAPVPPGSDAVVMQEDVQLEADGRVSFREPVDAGTYVRKTGSDLALGAAALGRGALLGPSELALLATLGHVRLPVIRRPRVAVLSTGDELVELGQAAPGRLVDSNGLVLSLRLRQLGCDVVELGIAGDDRAALQRRFQAASGCDGVISSAGVSVGEADHVKEILTGLGATLHLEKVAIRPGKPLVFATGHGQFFFGLPGNPVSSRVTFEVFVAPALRQMMGQQGGPRLLPARLGKAIGKVAALTYFSRVRLESRAGALWAVPLAQQGSGQLTSLVGAEALAILPAGPEAIAEGAPVEVMPIG